MSRSPREILIRPVITEETSRLQFNPGRIRTRHQAAAAEANQQVVFQVVPTANKIQIRRAVEEMFEVKVVKVRTMNCLGKEKRVGRHLGRRPNWKKAVVTLAEGETLNAAEGV